MMKNSIGVISLLTISILSGCSDDSEVADNNINSIEDSSVSLKYMSLAENDGSEIPNFELWSVNSSGDALFIKDLNAVGGSNPFGFTEYNGYTYFGAHDGLDYVLWSTDGTSDGTNKIETSTGDRVNVSTTTQFIPFKDKIYFSGQTDEQPGLELWCTDGTPEGTQMVKDLVSGFIPGDPSDMKIFNGKLYFAGQNTIFGSKVLWSSDGTEAGTRMLSLNEEYIYDPKEFTEYDGSLYFSAFKESAGRELWSVRASDDFINMIDIESGSGNSNPRHLTVFNNKLFYTAFTSAYDLEVWFTDHSADNVQLLSNIGPLININSDVEIEIDSSSETSQLFVYNGMLYFNANDLEHGNELWKSDGTSAGTQLVKDINVNINDLEYTDSSLSSSSTFSLTDSLFYFNADSGTGWPETWVSDGTSNGTVELLDVNGNQILYSSISSYENTNVGNYLYFNKNIEGNAYNVLMASDGSQDNTQVVRSNGYSLLVPGIAPLDEEPKKMKVPITIDIKEPLAE